MCERGVIGAHEEEVHDPPVIGEQHGGESFELTCEPRGIETLQPRGVGNREREDARTAMQAGHHDAMRLLALGQVDLARARLETLIGWASRELGADDALTLALLADKAEALERAGDREAAIATLSTALAVARQRPASDEVELQEWSARLERWRDGP